MLCSIAAFQDPLSVDESLTDVLLQHYIDKPLLVNGHKFDLRVYVAVTCLDPLRVYVYEEGERMACSRHEGEGNCLLELWLMP